MSEEAMPQISPFIIWDHRHGSIGTTPVSFIHDIKTTTTIVSFWSAIFIEAPFIQLCIDLPLFGEGFRKLLQSKIGDVNATR